VATLSVIVPTIPERREHLERCLAAYEETAPGAQLIVVEGKRSCGEAWIAGARKATGDLIHFTADDLVPLPGWLHTATVIVERGGLPAANVLTRQRADGAWYDKMHAPCWLLGERIAENVLVPFFSREQFEMGKWCLPIHYGSDDWVSFLADRLGIQTFFAPAYSFGHHAAPEGRLTDSRQRDIPILCDHMAAFGTPPRIYLHTAQYWGWTSKTKKAIRQLVRDPSRVVPPPPEPDSHVWHGPNGYQQQIVHPAALAAASPPPRGPMSDEGYVWNGPARP
jgi:hypothetical protein